uniref:Uncharacterized protein n=1 Tax=Arundo donax TaxID=35708 RepID=A0A0A9C668_ARUDO
MDKLVGLLHHLYALKGTHFRLCILKEYTNIFRIPNTFVGTL